MAIASSAVTVSLQDAELHIRSGFPDEISLDSGSIDTSLVQLSVENHIIEIWFVNLERCKHHTPLINFLKRQMRLMLWCLDVDLPGFEGNHPHDFVPWISVSPGHKVFHLENLIDD